MKTSVAKRWAKFSRRLAWDESEEIRRLNAFHLPNADLFVRFGDLDKAKAVMDALYGLKMAVWLESERKRAEEFARLCSAEAGEVAR